METSHHRPIVFKLAIIWLAIILLGSFWLAGKGGDDPVSLTLLPQVPREGEPLIATFKITNPSPANLAVSYRFYANSDLLQEGSTTMAAGFSRTYQYAYRNPLQVGERINFVVQTSSELGSDEAVLSSPPYPPQIWSSFVSFASFSTSVMGSMTTMEYYRNNFSDDAGLMLGMVISLVLISLLIFRDVTRPVRFRGPEAVLARLNVKFYTVTWILLIVFLGFIYTKLALIFAIR